MARATVHGYFRQSEHQRLSTTAEGHNVPFRLMPASGTKRTSRDGKCLTAVEG